MTKIVIGCSLILFAIYNVILNYPRLRADLDVPERGPAYVAGGLFFYLIFAGVGVVLIAKGRREKNGEPPTQ